ncbi:aminotransferase class I/II-fold pyridoxal phosphate-dependent enzyme [Geopsychrobacter electrodiphilus]|uniref:aminotransferase class I/II-fold pyridoxal phosphate-dependent enzyme n=1 Tax=Geopsychrobacter electrodiphilus TaxID=225196 RepID=UPI0003755674|nr:aminotransferase class I/II-fold pyridoxal phosphate-dependent enzyme [Geopsychrobacter electrodiphilus]
MNPLAAELNDLLEKNNPHVLAMLSDLGRNLFFPKGILSQSAEAKEKAHKFNATIGTATENGGPMYLQCIQDKLSAFNPADIYPYAPPAGKPQLRQLWREKMLRENPAQQNKHFGMPIVTNALTHGLAIIADLFVEAGDHLILPDMLWGNYNLTFGTRRNAIIKKYNTFTEAGGFDVEAFRACLKQTAAEKGKAVVILNFPNNPSGYTPTIAEGDALVAVMKEQADAGCNIVAVTDDAYFGLFYEDSMQESLFGKLANLHPRIFSIKLDGATKEEFVWGFRTGFITFADGKSEQNEAVLTAIEKKALGIIRGTISNCPHPSQTFVIEALKSPDFVAQKQQKLEILKGRALKVKEVLSDVRFTDSWSYYPFNSGYFMCLKLKRVDAEALRVHLLDKYGVGAISVTKTDLRIAFSCIDEKDIAELFELIYKAELDLA